MLAFYFLFLQMYVTGDPAQEKPLFSPPLKIPMYLSGSFGEIRSDHFHSGIDIKTQGITGHKVYSIDQGYVSRIKIQTGGYGISLYIDHPDGFTTVYGHLDAYNEEIDSYVKKFQYSKMSHTVDIYPDKSALPVKKGEFIAYSGNSGSSGGPHLHFEIRKSQNQIPINPLKAGLIIPDKIPPKISGLFVYPQGQNQFITATPTEYKLKMENGVYKLSSQQTLNIAGAGRFGLAVNDNIDGSTNNCGIYILELSIAGKVIYLFRADEFSFDETRYLNAHIDYRYKTLYNRRIQLLFRKPNNRLSMYPVMINDGVYNFQAGLKYPVRIRAADAQGNESILEFEVEGLPAGTMVDTAVPDHTNIFKWNTNNYFENSNIRLEIPRGSLYEDTPFEYARTDSKTDIYPYIHFIGSPVIPLHHSSKLSFFAGNIPDSLRSKTIIVKINENDKPSGGKGIWVGDWISTRINSFGKFTIDVDTIPPSIIPLNIKSGGNMTGQSAIRFKISDDRTGISGYKGFIDNKWVLFEYDPKNDLIYYIFDKSRLTSGTKHELSFTITDGVGNQSSRQISFFW
jgi:hypothetical protein